MTARTDNLSILNSVDCAEQKSSQEINVPCLNKVKQTRGTLSNPVKYLHRLAQNKKGFEISSPRRERQQELCCAQGEIRVPAASASPAALWRFPGVLARASSGCLRLHPKGSPRSPAQGSAPRFKQARLPCSLSLCRMQNSRVLARRPRANLVMGEQSRIFKINKLRHRRLGSAMVPGFQLQLTG